MSGWDCTICTFYNKNSAFKCKMCGASRGTSTRQARLPDQPLMHLEPPGKKAKFSKSRIAAPVKSTIKQSKSVHSSESAGTSGIQTEVQTEPQRRTSSTSRNDATDSNAATGSGSVVQKHKSGVERVIVGQPVYNGDLRGGQFVPQWDPYVMVETVSNVRLFPHPMIDAGAYTTSSPSSSGGHVGVSGLKMTNMFPMYGSSHTSLKKDAGSQQEMKAKGYAKRGAVPYSHSGKDKGPQKGKTVIGKGKRNYQKNKDEQLLSDNSSNPTDNKDVTKQTKSFSKAITRTGSNGRGESSRQRKRYGESSKGHSSLTVWPTIPNLDYSSGKRLKVTFNNETVFITQYKLLK